MWQHAGLGALPRVPGAPGQRAAALKVGGDESLTRCSSLSHPPQAGEGPCRGGSQGAGLLGSCSALALTSLIFVTGKAGPGRAGGGAHPKALVGRPGLGPQRCPLDTRGPGEGGTPATGRWRPVPASATGFRLPDPRSVPKARFSYFGREILATHHHWPEGRLLWRMPVNHAHWSLTPGKDRPQGSGAVGAGLPW